MIEEVGLQSCARKWSIPAIGKLAMCGSTFSQLTARIKTNMMGKLAMTKSKICLRGFLIFAKMHQLLQCPWKAWKTEVLRANWRYSHGFEYHLFSITHMLRMHTQHAKWTAMLRASHVSTYHSACDVTKSAGMVWFGYHCKIAATVKWKHHLGCGPV